MAEAQAGGRPSAARIERLLPAGVVLLYVLLSLLTYDQVDEDAFIYFRCAENLAGGYGYVFNRGGPPVESGSSVLWQLLLVVLVLLPIHIVTSTKLLGIACGAASLLATIALGRRVFSYRSLAYAPALLTAVSVPFLTWGQRGLETPLYAFTVIWTTLFLVDPKLSRYWHLPAIALFLTRPEGAFILLALAPFFLVNRSRFAELLLKPGLFLAAALLVVEAVRLLYFHDLVPHAFYKKIDFFNPASVRRTHTFLSSSHLYHLSPLLLVALLRPSFWRPERVIVLSVSALLLTWNFMAADYKPHFRHMAPALPLLYVLLLCAIDHLVPLRWRRRRLLFYGVSLALLIDSAAPSRLPGDLGAQAANPLHVAFGQLLRSPGRYLAATATKIATPDAFTFLDEKKFFSIGYGYEALVGKFIRLNYPEGITIVYDQMGQTPWYAGADKTFIDSWGLTDRPTGYYYFSRRAEYRRGVGLSERVLLRLTRWLFPEEQRIYSTPEILDYLFDADPHLILTNQFLVRRNRFKLPSLLERHPRMAERYVRRFELDDLVVIYERRDMRAREVIVPDLLSVREF
jgi:hypothetical protein